MRRIARQGWRQLAVLLALLLTLAFLIRNLFAMQVLQAGSAVMMQHYRDEVASPSIQQPVRGTIVDVNGNPLVATVTVFKLGAYPALIQDRAKAASAITNIIFPLQLPQGTTAPDKKAAAQATSAYRKHYQAILHKLGEPWSYVCLAGDDSDTCPLRNDISTHAADRIRALKMPGFDLEPRSKPSYPNGPLAAHLLGFVNYEYPHGAAIATGRYGLEQYYNDLLSGVEGRAAVRQDTSGNTIRVGPGSDQAPQQGAQLTLWVDSYVQLMVENELAQLVKQFNPRDGTIIVERPSDGAILASASWPRYDPGKWQDVLKQDPKHPFGRFDNPAVSKEYEPGSTFKPIMASIGLDTGSFGQWTPVPDNGVLVKDGIKIQDWCGDSCSFRGTTMTIDTMLHYSSNIAAAEYSHLIPNIPFYKYLDNFGFGQPTGVDLAFEIGGDVRKPGDEPPSKLLYVPAYKDTTAYGQGIAVTPLQMINAYAALANGGKLMVPHVVKAITQAGKTTFIAPRVQRQVITQATSDLISSIIVHSAVGGEACRALVPGYDVAAKTGTTEPNPFHPDQTIASTLAYGPENLPPDQQFVVLVELDRPNVIFGSETAAPAVHDILQGLFNYYHRQPDQGIVTQPSHRCSGPLATN